MNDPGEERHAIEARREQMVKLVTRSFYKELVNYGVQEGEILRVASHLLDNVMGRDDQPKTGVDFYSSLFTLASVVDEWESRRTLSVGPVSIRPLEQDVLPRLARWLEVPAARDSFISPFPEGPAALAEYFAAPSREYFTIFHEGAPAGIVGAENIDLGSHKLEMRKLVGEPGLHGKGVGKRATFAFLWHAFMTRGMHKVYLHSRDINIRNLNLNSRFGFEVEGVFFEEIEVDGRREDIVRMALTKPVWLKIFGAAQGLEKPATSQSR